MNVYQELLARVGTTIINYRADLEKHDKEWIADNPGVSFVHATREDGTHLYPLFPADQYPPAGASIPYLFGTATREKLVTDILSAVEHLQNHIGVKAWHYYDGRRLRPMSYGSLLMVVRAYVSGILRQWEEQEKRAAA